MRKIRLILLSALYLLCFAGCESSNSDVKEPSSSTVTTNAKISITSVSTRIFGSRAAKEYAGYVDVNVTGVTLSEVDDIWCRIETDSNISETKTASGHLYNSLSGTINCLTADMKEGTTYYVQAFVKTENGAIAKSSVKSFRCGQ